MMSDASVAAAREPTLRAPGRKKAEEDVDRVLTGLALSSSCVSVLSAKAVNQYSSSSTAVISVTASATLQVVAKQ